jgi:hypothetical protein
VATVYVIGAGASRHAQYPLASEMGKGLIEFMLGVDRHPYAPIQARCLIKQFGHEPNIEEVVTELSLRIESAKAAGIPADASPCSPGNLRGWIGRWLREWFHQIHTGTAAAYAEFADKLVQAGDVIITFNYDYSLERELKRTDKWDVAGGYGFPFAAPVRSSQVLTLKLHGSMNWLWPVPFLGQRPLIYRADLEHLGYSDLTDFTPYLYGNGGAIPCLILPDREKKFFYETSFGIECREFWDVLWEQAAKAITRTQRLVLCGYSLLPVDQRACDVLLNAPRTETHITVVSGGQSGRIASNLRDAGFRSVDVFKNGFFEDWVHREAGVGTPHPN